jgi:hypothetical protein
MATIRREIALGISAEEAWDAARDFSNLHRRLVPGFATDARLDGSDRLVTFFTGNVLRERLVALDEELRRVVWSIVDGPYSHHNGSLEVLEEDGGCRLVWTADLLPDEAAERTAAMMDRGCDVIRKTLDRRS